MAKNIFVYIGAIFAVICALNGVFAYNYASLEDKEGTIYVVNWNSFECQNATVYVEENETIYTSKTNMSEFSGLPQNYSPFRWGNIAFGWTWESPNPNVYYILVYDGSNNGINKYDTIAWSTDENLNLLNSKG